MNETEVRELARTLAGLGCPPAKCAEMAARLDQRARQLAARTGRTHAEALQHWLGLMRQGWAAQQSRPPAD